MNRLDDIELNTPESTLSIHIRRVVVIQTGCVQEGSVTIPVINPYERQVIRTHICDSVDQRMNNQHQFGDTVASGRCSRFMCVRTAGRATLAEEIIRVAFVDIMTFEMIVRIVDCQVQLNDTVASRLNGSQRIDIDTTGP